MYRIPTQTKAFSRQRKIVVISRRDFSSSNINRDGQQVRRSTFRAEREKAEKASSNDNNNENIFNRFRAWYGDLLERRPLITKSITGGLIAATGDTICQFGTFHPSEHEEKQKKEQGSKHYDSDTENEKEVSFWRDVYDPMRSVHFYMMGAFFSAPLNHIWFNWMAKNIPGQSMLQITKRVGMDQLLWTPVWTVAWLCIFWSLEGSDPKDIPQGLIENYPGVMTANWVLWIPAQYINFYYMTQK